MDSRSEGCSLRAPVPATVRARCARSRRRAAVPKRSSARRRAPRRSHRQRRDRAANPSRRARGSARCRARCHGRSPRHRRAARAARARACALARTTARRRFGGAVTGMRCRRVQREGVTGEARPKRRARSPPLVASRNVGNAAPGGCTPASSASTVPPSAGSASTIAATNMSPRGRRRDRDESQATPAAAAAGPSADDGDDIRAFRNDCDRRIAGARERGGQVRPRPSRSSRRR